MVNGQTRRQVVTLAALSLMLLLALIALPWSAGRFGQSDFIAYWSASRLLLEGRDPHDVEALRALQRAQYPERGPVVLTWNPPWLPVLLLPVAALPYQTAARLWLLINLAILAGAGGWLWRRSSADRRNGRLALAMLAAVLFPPSLTAIGTGQIIPVVLLAALAIFDWQWRDRRLGTAGTALALVLLKPQVTFLAAAFSAWYALRHRQMRFIAGAAAMLFGLIAAVTLLYPGWVNSYLVLVGKPLSPPSARAIGPMSRAARAGGGTDEMIPQEYDVSANQHPAPGGDHVDYSVSAR